METDDTDLTSLDTLLEKVHGGSSRWNGYNAVRHSAQQVGRD